MGIINIVAKFLVLPQKGSLLIGNGELKIYGLDEGTSALLQTEFQELQLLQSSSHSKASTSSSSSFLRSSTVLSTSYGEEPLEFDDAFQKITSYLHALDLQEFSVVSAFKDDLQVPASEEEGDGKIGSGPGQYKIYVWTMQK